MFYLNRLISDLFSTRGVLTNDRRIICHTLELPWFNNQQNISCIPTGVYEVARSVSQKFGLCYRFSSVHNRSGILIHAGNTIKDTRGCILVGLDVTDVGVIHSISAMQRLHDTLPEEFTLTIRNI